MASQQYFQIEMLLEGSSYIPWLWEPTDPNRPITIELKDHIEYVEVVLIEPKGSSLRVGLIPLEHYKVYLRKIGLRKGMKD